MKPFLFPPSRPLVPLAAAFAGGVSIAASPLWPWAALAGGCAVCALVVRRDHRASAFLLAAGFAAAGAVRQLSADGPSPNDVSHLAGGPILTVQGTAADEPEAAGRTLRMVVAATGVRRNGEPLQSCSGLVLVIVPRGEGDSAPDFGDLVEARGRIEFPEPATNPGAFDERAYLARRGIFCTVRVHRAESLRIERERNGPGISLQRLAGAVRRSLGNTARRYLTSIDASLLCGVLLGSRVELPRAVQDDFQLTGTSHILATAGLHVGILALMLQGALRLCRVSRRRSAAVVMLILLVYALAAGGRPAVVRAVVVSEALLAGYLLQRETDAANSLALAAMLLLVVRPGSLFEVGFQLSFGTVASIIAIIAAVRPYYIRWLGGEPLGRTGMLTRMRVRFADMLLLTTSAQAGSAPLVAEYFNIVSPSGLPANALIVPVLFPVIGFGLLLWAAGLAGVPLVPQAAAAVLHPLLSFVLRVAQTCSHLPLAVVPVPSPGWVGIILLYGGLAAAVRAIRRRAPISVLLDTDPVNDRVSVEPATV